MSVRLIAGRAGTGKTHYCLTQICQALAHGAADGPRLIMLVPEQAALQMERGILSMSRVRCADHSSVDDVLNPNGPHSGPYKSGATPVLGRCEVLGFRRLAHRILNETPGKTPLVLSSNGRQMALRHLLNKHRRDLREFHRVAQRTGFIRLVAQGISSLMQECAAPDKIAAAAAEAESQNNPAARRLHDLALIYRAYLEYLGDDRVDPEGVLDLARARLQRSAWLRDAQIWIDGFAGLTQQQMRMIVELASRSSQVEIALLLDPARGPTKADPPSDTLSLFSRTEQTWANLSRAFREAGIGVDPPIILDRSPLRFAEAPALVQVERDLFCTPPRNERAPWPAPVPCQNVRLLVAPDRRSEVAAAVRGILDLVQQPRDPLRFRNIAVIVRDLTPYHDLLSAQLRAHNIPFFIDRRRSTHHHPLIAFVRAALAMHTRPTFGPSLIAILKTDLSPLSDDQTHRLENYMLAYGLFSVESWAQSWTYAAYPRRSRPEPNSYEMRALEELNALRARILALLGDWLPGPAPSAHPHARTWLTRLYGLIERFEAPLRIAQWHQAALEKAELDIAAEHQQVWNDLCVLFDELADALGEEPMSARQFMECLEAGLAEFTLGLVPATLDQVLVSSIERSRHPPIKAAFVLGLSDQDFPARIDDDELLGDPEKSALARANIDLGRSRADRILDERMLAYVAFTRPSELLWVSYPRADHAGKPVLPSPYWSALRSAIPLVPVEDWDRETAETVSTANELAAALAHNLREKCERGDQSRAREEAVGSRTGGPSHSGDNPSLTVGALSTSPWTDLYNWARQDQSAREILRRALAALTPPKVAALSSESCSALWPEHYKTSVSALEDFAACPFRHFARKGLRLEPRSIHELSAIDLGSLYHGVLQQFVNEMIETNKTLHDFTDEAIASRLSHYCESVLPGLVESKGLDEPTRRLTLWRGRRELHRAVLAQKKTISGSPLNPCRTELSFGRQIDDQLPALKLTLENGKTVLLRGQIDRVDLLPTDGPNLAVVYDYKRSGIKKRLVLGEAYHGLALQLLAYLLVIRDSGKSIRGVELLPGGAFYLPLLGPPKKVNHPDEATADDFSPFDEYRPRGVIDFDHLRRLDPKLSIGRSNVFSAAINKGGGPGHVDTTDVVHKGGMNHLLDHVRTKMIELAQRWLSGDIAVSPFKLGEKTPCTYCELGSVCRMEYASRNSRNLETLNRTEVLDKVAGKAKPSTAHE